MSLKRAVSRNTKAFRLRMGLTQEQLAKKAKLHPQYVALLERTPKNVTLEVVEQLAKALQVTPYDILSVGALLDAKSSDLEDLEHLKNIATSLFLRLSPKGKE